MKLRALEGASDSRDGLRWHVDIWSDRPGNIKTFIELTDRGHHLTGGGFGGPALYPGELLNEWVGHTDDCPSFVLLRADPTIKAVTAVFTNGVSKPVLLSAELPDYGIRVGAVEVPAGANLDVLVPQTTQADTDVTTQEQVE